MYTALFTGRCVGCIVYIVLFYRQVCGVYCVHCSVLQAGVWGDPASWNSSNIQEAGVIVHGLNVTEIQQMSFDLSAASKLGEFDVWSTDKVSTTYTVYHVQPAS
jgi:hypothetical protein